MKYLNFFLVLIVLGSFLTSCKKEIPILDESNQTIQESNKWWIPAAVYIIIKLSEGQYSKITYSDGTVVESCDGIGSCAISGVINDDSNYAGEDISSDPAGVDFEFITEEGILGVDTDDNIIFGMDETADPEARDAFFYDSAIHITREYLIDHSHVLTTLGLDEPIVVEPGYYAVNERDGLKYIIIGNI